MRCAFEMGAGAAFVLASCFPMRCVAAQVAALPPAASAVQSALPAQLPLRRAGEDEPGASIVWRAAGMLLLAGGAGGWLLWRRGVAARAGAGPGTQRELQAVVRLSSHALTPQASVHSVRWNGQDLLLGCTAQQVTLLARRPVPGRDEEHA